MPASEYTWEDVQKAPEDARRREAIGGERYISGPATVRHQRVRTGLMIELNRLLETPGHGEVLPGPVGVAFPETGEGVQPDLLFISRDRRGIVAEDEIRGAPDLMVEVLSPDTEERDRGIKRDLYERQGVGEYWLVDPGEEAVEVWRFGDSGAEGEATHERQTERLPIRVGGERVGEIDLEDVFARGA